MIIRHSTATTLLDNDNSGSIAVKNGFGSVVEKECMYCRWCEILILWAPKNCHAPAATIKCSLRGRGVRDRRPKIPPREKELFCGGALSPERERRERSLLFLFYLHTAHHLLVFEVVEEAQRVRAKTPVTRVREHSFIHSFIPSCIKAGGKRKKNHLFLTYCRH